MIKIKSYDDRIEIAKCFSCYRIDVVCPTLNAIKN